MQRSGTGNDRLRRGRGPAAAVAAILLASGALAGLPPAHAISPPTIDPAALPPDGPPGPVAPMKQNSYCTEVGTLPGTDFRLPPKYMEMLNLTEAWQFGRGEGVKVAVIDTGVTPHPRFPHLIPGGDYVMAGGDGLSDCDAHGTIVASMIGAAPANGAAPPPAVPRRPVTIPTTEKPPPPQTVTLSPVPPQTQTITVVPAPPSEEGAPGAAPAPGPVPPAAPGQAPGQAPAGTHGGGTVTIPSYSGGRRVVGVDNTSRPRPLDPPPAPAPPPDAFSGIAPDVELISIRQSSQAFGLKDPYTGDEDPQTAQKIDNVQTMARAIVHAANMGASVINISDVTCMSARNVIDQRVLGAAVHYAAVDKNAVIVAAAGDSSKKDCKQNPVFDPLQPSDPRDWNAVTTVVTPSWFSDYVLTVGAVDANGQPMSQMSIAGPWVSIAAPGTDVVGLSPRDDGLINAIDGPDNTLLVPAGTSFSAAIVSGVVALVRAKYPELSAYQIKNRLIHTARPPARGVDNQVGYGVVDPVAALTWDVPEGPVQPPKQLSAPLALPKPPTERNMVPVWVAAGGLTGALLIGGAVFGTATLMRRSRKQR
ncbi:type VII secretion-associated serine protease mycosin [Mycobacterium persicum]|uniref:Mycosin-5 n=1 Tax=Mycobacterium persicum TaxID=1487726 RepID=A0A1X0L2X0_9MYCO|nr:type VII secretion-associated serine protease mycosin [Mycobacterium persicum]KZS84610.1 peptidase S8 [Mycobacterium persicum]ORB54455.1 type VII secretion-associated serine protease mycosin [Mycobacterium persicum]ORB93277.1 type VII secretion-associated serine protease mycosin [Mycobacterium persicum]ORC00029.1 type VII secretion-associated serine protease mycosin [Mycobacterium persicum]ORC05357.1 type VII secretion-associated serine protease mycosin [Mycobacterium persicum]